MRDKEDDDSRASVKRLKAQVKIAVKKYTKLSCRALCDKVQDKLPAEIRSRIYEEVLGSQPYLCVSYCPQKYCNACGAPDFANLEWGWYELRDQLGHICDVEYVGASALQELAETWYRITSVLFACHANENDLCYTKSLEDTQDIWDTSELMKNRIKNVIVDIGPSFLRKLVSLKSDGLDFPEETMAEFGYPGVLERESYVFTHMFFIKGMNSLSCFRPGTKITIRIRNVHQNNPGKQDSEKEQLLAMLKVFFPAVSGLRDCGLRVEGLIGETRINEHFEFSAESWANKVMASG
jgi:hypothetical protein